MGYTHYWTATNDISEEAWARLGLDAVRLFTAAPMPLRVEFDEDGPPEITADLIRFNGLGDDGHETFWLSRKADDFQFCKTAQKPYDLVVCAILACVAEHAPEVDIKSDGDAYDWEPAVVWATSALGREIRAPGGV